MKKKIIIGIDPDCQKNGVAINKIGKVTLCNLSFFDLFETLKNLLLTSVPILVMVEGGWLNKSNWHTKKQSSAAVNTKIGERTGANHETGKKIVEMLEYLEITHVVVKPTKSKLDAKSFKRMTGIKEVTNQEKRDAYMLIFGL